VRSDWPAGSVCRPLAAVRAVVGEQGDLQLLRHQVLRVAERDAVVRRRDPEHVGARLRVDEAGAAVVGDADRHPIALGDLPRGVDACSVGDDRDRVRIERPTRVLDRLPRREVVVVELDGDPVALLACPDAAARVQVRGRQLEALANRLRDVRTPRHRDVDGHGQVAEVGAAARALAAPGCEQGQAHEKEQTPTHEPKPTAVLFRDTPPGRRRLPRPRPLNPPPRRSRSRGRALGRRSAGPGRGCARPRGARRRARGRCRSRA